jgi:peptidoglycan hydrolase CwlO-like protein
MSTVKKPLKNPTSHDISRIQLEINWIENKMNEVREEIKKRPSKIKHLNDLQRQLDHNNTILLLYTEENLE